jgi:hypothetical protein
VSQDSLHHRRLFNQRHEAPPPAAARTRQDSEPKRSPQQLGPLIRTGPGPLDAARHPLTEGDEPRNEDRDYPAWSSRPETEAAQGLPWIALRQPDSEALDAVEALVRNPDAIIRYLVVRDVE